MAAGDTTFLPKYEAIDDHCSLSDIRIIFPQGIFLKACAHCDRQMKTLGFLVNHDANKGDLVEAHELGNMPEVFE